MNPAILVDGDSAHGHVANALFVVNAEAQGLLSAEEMRAALRRRLEQALEAIKATDARMRALCIEAATRERERRAV